MSNDPVARRVAHVDPCTQCRFPDSDALDRVRGSLRWTREQYPAPFNSAHEGLGVIQEEFDELKDAIRANDRAAAAREATQLAAMAARFVADLGEE